MLVYELGDRKMNLKISAERGDGMLNYLEQGMILYVMAAVCVIGVISRFAANRCYKSLIRQSDNLAAAKDKQLQQMKTKYESIYRMNCGMKNTEAFVSKMQQQYRIAGTRLTSWENCSIYCAAAAFLIGAVSSLILYLNKGSVQNCVLYLAGGSLMAAGMIVLSGLMGNSSNKDLLETAQSYVKSSYFLFAWFPFFHYSSIRMRWISCAFPLALSISIKTALSSIS